MKIGIGIDTGGTYTDAVIYDFEAKEILSSAKALTTKEDLALGIGNALDGLPTALREKAEIISLSTTLATNACVENKGGRAKLVFIGVDPNIVLDVGKQYGFSSLEEIYFVDGRCSFWGDVEKEPDWDAFARESEAWFRDAEAVGIVEIHAMKNPALEKQAKQVIKEKFGVDAICGHELFSDLNSIQRGSSTLLNARLIPIIQEFLQAIKSALEQRNLRVPVVIVRSDGSLMSEKFTAVRPVETLLCGPAASVIGGAALTKEKDSVIIDMGGTTTDIAIVRDGEPVKAKDGVNVGKWRTYVKGVYIDTFGLGGDSAVRVDRHGKLTLESFRVIPLSILADRWPIVTEKLTELVQSNRKHTKPLHEFFCLVKDIVENDSYTPEEQAFCKALEQGPLPFSEAAEAIGKDVYNLQVDRLLGEGIVMRAGMTPTDIMHIRGDFSRYNAEAAKLGAAYLALCMDILPEELPERVYDMVKKKLYVNLVRVLLEQHFPKFRKDGLPSGVKVLVDESWKLARDGNPGLLQFGFTTPAALVGIGAPTHIFLPDVAKALGTRCVVPKHAGVANAVGAVVGHIAATCEIEVKPAYDVEGITGYVVYGKAGNSHVDTEETALSIALDEARTAAREEAVSRGATGDITVTCEVVTESAHAKEIQIVLGMKAVATAVGGIAL